MQEARQVSSGTWNDRADSTDVTWMLLRMRDFHKRVHWLSTILDLGLLSEIGWLSQRMEDDDGEWSACNSRRRVRARVWWFHADSGSSGVFKGRSIWWLWRPVRGVDWVLWLNQTGLYRSASELSEHVLNSVIEGLEGWITKRTVDEQLWRMPA